MLRIHGDRASLLAALTAHWADQQLQIPPTLPPWVQPIRRRPRAHQPSSAPSDPIEASRAASDGRRSRSVLRNLPVCTRAA
jgi:hypothetical protein